MRNPARPPLSLLAPAALILLAAQPLPAASQDDRIEAAAKGSYNFRTYLKADTIQVAARDGVVTLTGEVAESFHKDLAEETVAGLPGVKRVDNQLRLAGTQPQEPSDAWITMKVKAALAFHKNVSATDTQVQTDKGVVLLTGRTPSAAQKERTGQYARDVEGVQSVRNELVVTGHRPPLKTLGEKIDDASITAQVKTRLLLHKDTRVLSSRVKTRQGVVTVRGEVRSAAEKDLVTRLAEDIRGVRQVNNLMNIRSL